MPQRPRVLTDDQVRPVPCTAPGCNAKPGEPCRVTEIAGAIGDEMRGFHFARLEDANTPDKEHSPNGVYGRNPAFPIQWSPCRCATCLGL